MILCTLIHTFIFSIKGLEESIFYLLNKCSDRFLLVNGFVTQINLDIVIVTAIELQSKTLFSSFSKSETIVNQAMIQAKKSYLFKINYSTLSAPFFIKHCF